MRKYYIIALIILGCSFGVKAQNRILYNHHMLNPETYNPGFMNIQREISVTLLYKLQYLSQAGMAQDGYLNAHYHIGKNGGIGLTVNNQNIEKFNNLEVGANYVYHVWLSNYMALGFGLNANFYQQSFNPGIYNVQNFSDPVLGDSRKQAGINFGFGVSLQDKNLIVNLSVPRFFANSMVNPKATWSFKYAPIYLGGSYHIEFNKWFSLTPGILMRMGAGTPANIVANVYTGLLEEKLLLGAGYNSGNSVNLTVGYQFDFGLRISYNFETAPFNSRMKGLGTTHELGVAFYSLFEKPGFDKRKYLNKNGKVKGMRVIKYKGDDGK